MNLTRFPTHFGFRARPSGESDDLLRHLATQSFKHGPCQLSVHELRPASGPIEQTLFLFHGRLFGADSWRPLMRELAGRVHCISVDFPPYGDSTFAKLRYPHLIELASCIRELVRQLTPVGSRVVLVGHDTGGTLALIGATDTQIHVGGAILINSVPLRNSIHPISRFSALWFRNRLDRLLAGCPNLPASERHSILNGWCDRDRRQRRIRSINELAESWPGHHERLYWKQELRRLDLPVLLLWGGLDPINRLEDGLDLLAELPAASFFADQTSGHWPAIENSGWVAARVREFLFRIPADAEARG